MQELKTKLTTSQQYRIKGRQLKLFKEKRGPIPTRWPQMLKKLQVREISTGSTKQQEFLVEENLSKVSQFAIRKVISLLKLTNNSHTGKNTLKRN